MTKRSIKTSKSIDLCVVPEIATAPVQQSIPSCKWDAEDLRAIAKLLILEAQRITHLTMVRCDAYAFFRAGCPAMPRSSICGYTADAAPIAARCVCHAASMAVHQGKTGASKQHGYFTNNRKITMLR